MPSVSACPSCELPVGHDQRYCLACGARVRPHAVPVAARDAPGTGDGSWTGDGRWTGDGPAAAHGSRAGVAGAAGAAAARRSRRLPRPRSAAALLLAALGTGTVLGSASASAPARSTLVAVAPPAATASPSPVPTAAPAASAGPDGSGLPDDSGRSSSGPAPAPVPTAAPAPSPVAAPAEATPVPAPAATPEPTPVPGATPTPTPATGPPAKHVLVVALTGQDFGHAFGADSPAAYLARDLTAQGALLARFHPVSTGSLANDLALLGGAAPTTETQADCAEGDAPACHVTAATTLPGELDAAGTPWKVYVEGAADPCAAPAAGGFTAVRDPLPYLDDLATCGARGASLDALTGDLAEPATAPALAWVVPDRCHDGHEADCPDAAADGPDGLSRADAWLRQWVPAIVDSEAFADDGLLVILFDGGGLPEPAAGQDLPATGALLLSRFARAGVVSRKPYDPYSLARTIAATLGVDPPGAAGNDGVAVLGREAIDPEGRRSPNVDGTVTGP